VRARATHCLAAAALAAGFVGCFTPVGPDGLPIRDPCEGSNRPVFGFNDGLDRYVLNPLAEGWRFITFHELRVALDKLFYNLRFPARFVSSLGQGKGGAAASETGRFLVNSTVGIVGLWDPATRLGIARHDEDFGQMFGKWGIGSGPYWMVPVLGPSGPRDFVGFLFDSVFSLTILLPGAGALGALNARAIADPQIEIARESALDLYVFTRDGYLQRRDALVEDRDVPGGDGQGPPDELYELGEDEDFEDDEPLEADEETQP
jgi:phospholipid-binding lipoprotein MlaA